MGLFMTKINAAPPPLPAEYPSSFAEAKILLLAMLTEEEKAEIALLPSDMVEPRLHLTLGATIRHKFGLWLPTAENLLCSIAAEDTNYPSVMPDNDGTFYVDPDGASSILIRSIWKTLNGIVVEK
jgi:hypothetical protein